MLYYGLLPATAFYLLFFTENKGGQVFMFCSLGKKSSLDPSS